MILLRLLVVCLSIFFIPGQLWAQTAELPAAAPALPDLTGPQKHVLMQIAREAVDAAYDNRPSREATVEPRLTVPQPMVISIYVDGKLRARAWKLKGSLPLYLDARDLTYEALNNPKVTEQPFTPEELARAQVSLAVLSNYTKVADDSEVPLNSAVIIYHGFTEWLALPGDVESVKAADLLTYACEQAGLRPRVWLLPQTTIFWAKVEEMRETASGSP